MVVQVKNPSKHYKFELCPEDLHSLLSDLLAFEMEYLELSSAINCLYSVWKLGYPTTWLEKYNIRDQILMSPG